MLPFWRRAICQSLQVWRCSSEGFLNARHFSDSLRPIILCKEAPVMLNCSKNLHCSAQFCRKKRKSAAKKGADESEESEGVDVKEFDAAFIVQHGLKEMQEIEITFEEQLVKSLSLKVDLRVYEDFVVKFDDGKQHKLNRLGRIKLVSPLLISIDFTDNPSAIKPARLALEKSQLNITPRQEGVVLYISLPRITRERRENLANVATKKLLNDYKKALNEIYAKYDKETDEHENAKKIMNELLDKKRALEKKAIMAIEERRTQLLTEVV